MEFAVPFNPDRLPFIALGAAYLALVGYVLASVGLRRAADGGRFHPRDVMAFVLGAALCLGGTFGAVAGLTVAALLRIP